MIVAFDSLKFYKLKNETTVKILFFILYFIFVLSYVLPVGTPLSVESIVNVSSNNPAQILNEIKVENITYYLFSIGLLLVTSFIALIYATSYVMESENFPNKKAIRDSFIKIPVLIGFILLLIPPIFISSLFLFIPLIFGYYSLYFVPLLITEGKKNIFDAIIESFKVTRGFKLSIFFAQLTMYFIMNLPITLFGMSFAYTGYQNTLAEHLVISFLRAAYILMTGRMLGNFYLLIYKNKEKMKKIELELIRHTKRDENEDAEENDEEEN